MRNLSRRTFLQALTVGAASTCLGESHPSTCKANPNVLFLAIDDLNDWVGALDGYPLAAKATPNIDSLADSGVIFKSAHCTAPVCGASRNSLLSGLRPSTTGWYINADYKGTSESVLDDTPTLPEHFKNNGYKTLGAGKIFHTGVSDYRHTKQWTDSLPHYEITNKDLLARGYGYGAKGSKDHKYYPFPKDGGQIVTNFGPDTRGKSLCWGALDRSDIPKNGTMPDEYIANWASEKLKERHEDPFFLAVGFVRPHVPFTAPKEYFDKFPLDEITLPDIVGKEMSDIPLYGKAMAYGIIPMGDHAAVEKLGETFWKELIRAYLACVSFVDDQLGKVLRALRHSQYGDDTLVVLWSDHGQNFGEHRNWRKQSLWEESTRVPLIFSGPGIQKGKSCHRTVSLLDIYPTLTDLCGLPFVSSNEGDTLRKLVQNPSAEWIIPAVTTWGYKNHSVRSERWRYIQYRNGEEELYDHFNDGNEHINLSQKLEFEGIINELRQWLPVNNRLPAGQKTWKGDFLEDRVNEWQSRDGIPDWLL